MRYLLLLLLLSSVVLALLASSSLAQEEGAIIVVVETEREVSVTATADGSIDQDDASIVTVGTFQKTVTATQSGINGSHASGSAFQSTVIATTVVRGELIVSGEASRIAESDAEGRISSTSKAGLSFTVPVDTVFTFSGNFTASDDVTDGCGASASAGIAGIDASNAAFLYNAAYCDENSPDDASFVFVGSIRAGETVRLGVSADISMEDSEFIAWPGSGSATLNFEFYFGTPEVFTDGFEDGSTNG